MCVNIFSILLIEFLKFFRPLANSGRCGMLESIMFIKKYPHPSAIVSILRSTDKDAVICYCFSRISLPSLNGYKNVVPIGTVVAVSFNQSGDYHWIINFCLC